MNEAILTGISEKDDYLAVAGAITGAKQEFTDKEAEKLLTVYEQKMADAFGVSDKALVKLFMVLDTAGRDSEEPVKTAPLLGVLDEADREGLTVLVGLYLDGHRTPELAMNAKNAALAGNLDEGLALALARAALDALAGRRDIAKYREDISALIDFLGAADESKFYQASVFLWGVRAKWMN